MEKDTKIKFNVLAIICIIIFSFSVAPKTLQNDTYYTISIGEHIMENGVDGEDPFSWMELKYTYPHWLYDVAIYQIYNIRRNDRNIFVYSNFKLYTWSIIIYNKCKNK